MTTIERTILLKKMKSKIIEAKTVSKETARAELLKIGIITKSGRLSKHFDKK